MHRWLALLTLLAIGPASTGCIGTCTDDARSSVFLTVVDAETGEPVEAMVTFTVDGEGPREPDDGFGSTGQYTLAYEEEGTFDVTVSADGYETVMEQYEVDSDRCHVITVKDTIELTPMP